MRGVNKVILIGNLGADPEVRALEGDQKAANFRIATNRVYNTKDGQRKEETEWHRIVAWGKLAQIAEQYLKKGSSVYVEGRIRTRSWEDKEGNKRYSTEIVASSLSLLDRKSDQPDSDYQGSQAGNAESHADEPASDKEMDDLPF